MSREDELVNKLVQYYRNDSMTESVQVEKHYNHYGDRGIVDLVTDGFSLHLFEIKSPAAIDAATGANEIIRQFNRMREYYVQDHEIEPNHQATFELCFTPDVECLRHVETNMEMYKNITQTTPDSVSRSRTMVTMRPIAGTETQPALLFTHDRDFTNELGESGIIPNDPGLSEWIHKETTLIE